MRTNPRLVSFALLFVYCTLPTRSQAKITYDLITARSVQVGQRSEWRIEGVPLAANNFDPEIIRVDGTFTSATGTVTTVPAFWFQDYTRALVDGVEILTPVGAPQWRLRFTPMEIGNYSLAIAVQNTEEDGSAYEAVSHLGVAIRVSSAASFTGQIRVAPDRRYLELGDGQALRLIGANVCWGGARGTYDFDRWFPAMHEAGENFARLWFAPWSMGLEHKPGTLNRYDLAAAWQADYALELAERNGINVLIAMDHHGMFMSNDPAWGGSNNFWTRSSPYAVENGGPCASPNEFFTRAEAKKIYQKRLRYLIGRYGYSPCLLSWQFFNEIDNSFQPRAALVGDDVVAWHREMGQWLRANDPYHHLISTSLTGASDRSELWTLPEMDFAVYHSYGEADPARYVAKLSADFVQRYKKPIMIGEIGTSHLNWNIANDPYLRGFRQGIWGGTLGGSMGTSMSWWWEGIHDDNAYPFYTALRDIMARAGWNEGKWEPATFVENGPAPIDLGEPYSVAGVADPGLASEASAKKGPGSATPATMNLRMVDRAEPFNAQLPLNQLRLNPVSGEAALADPLAASRAAERISSYLHGTKNPQLQQHARFTAWFADKARLIFRVNSVAADADLLVRIDGEGKLRAPLVNKDGIASLNDEINQEFTIDLPVGKHRVEIAHTGIDWVNLKSIRFERLRPAPFVGGWEFKTEAIGLRNEHTAVVYVRSPHVAWPAGALRYNPPVVHGAKVMLKDWSVGTSKVAWYDPKTGEQLPDAATIVTTADGNLALIVPDFSEDAVAVVTK